MRRITAGAAAFVACGFAASGHAAARVEPPAPSIRSAEAPLDQLRQSGSHVSLGVRFIRFRQEISGIPVLGAEAVVTDGRGPRGDLLVDETHAGLRRPASARLSPLEGVQAARAAVGVMSLRGDPEATLAILPGASGGRLVWRVLLPALVPLASFEVLVDARSGDVVRTRDLLRRATGSAMLFDPNPIERQGSRAGLADAGDADSALLTSLRTPMSLPRLSDDANACTPNPFTLRGQWALARLPTTQPCAPGHDYSAVTRADDRFEALMAYAHVDRVQAYLQGLGFTNIINRPQVLNVNISLPTQPDLDNSFFDPTTGEISFGPGGVDDAEDADVIVHEYGHAIQEAQVAGFGDTPHTGAMSEGFSDYLAASISAAFSPGSAFDVCIAEWDAFSFPPPNECIRRTDGDPTVAQVMSPPCRGEIHCAGEVWSSALWDIRTQLGGPVTDRLVIQSHFSLTPTATFHDGARALLAADAALSGGANQAFLRGLLLSRGLLDPERLDDSPAEAVPLAVPGQASGSLSADSDQRDVYRLSLRAGAGVFVTLSGGGDFDIRLYGPGTANLEPARVVAGSTSAGTSIESFSYVPPATGDYFLEVAATSGSGSYTVAAARLDRDGDGRADEEDNCPAASNPGQEDLDRDGVGDVCDRFALDPGNDVDRDGFGANADNCPAAANPGQEDLDRDGVGDVCDRFPQDRANDIDRDGLGANVDNCPLIRNASQVDWDRDRRGDVCDRDARVTLSRVLVRGSRVRLRGERRPASLELANVRALVQRQVCRAGNCRYRRVRLASGATAIRGSRFELAFRLRREGRYRFRLELVDPRHERAKSRFVAASVRR